jgi:hypothetical protein
VSEPRRLGALGKGLLLLGVVLAVGLVVAVAGVVLDLREQRRRRHLELRAGRQRTYLVLCAFERVLIGCEKIDVRRTGADPTGQETLRDVIQRYARQHPTERLEPPLPAFASSSSAIDAWGEPLVFRWSRADWTLSSVGPNRIESEDDADTLAGERDLLAGERDLGVGAAISDFTSGG